MIELRCIGIGSVYLGLVTGLKFIQNSLLSLLPFILLLQAKTFELFVLLTRSSNTNQIVVEKTAIHLETKMVTHNHINNDDKKNCSSNINEHELMK